MITSKIQRYCLNLTNSYHSISSLSNPSWKFITEYRFNGIMEMVYWNFEGEVGIIGEI